MLRENEESIKRFLTKFCELTNDLCETKVKRITKKMKPLFPLKGKNLHSTCVIY